MMSRMNSHKRGRLLSIVSALALSLSCLLIFSGCGTASEPAAESETPGQETESPTQQPEPTTRCKFTVAPTPEPSMDVADETLSLEGYGAVGALADDDLSIMDMLAYAVQDEYLAHGEYLAIIDKFGDRQPYSNIAQAEETHLAFLSDIYTAYGIEFPEDNSADHIVVPDTLLEAAQTGVQAEIDNIAMYELFLTYDLPDDISAVFTALKDGSESHLRAFQQQVDRLS